MRRLLPILLCLCATLLRASPVDAFLDAYALALANGGSTSAQFELTETLAGAPVGNEVRGMVTYRGGATPFLRVTAARHWSENGEDRSAALVIGCTEGRIFLGDSGINACYTEDLARTGGHLMATFADGDFMLLMYPAMLDNLRGNGGAVVESDSLRTVPIQRLSVVGPAGRFELEVDARSYLPLRISRRETTLRGEHVKQIVFEGNEVSLRPPPPELFGGTLALPYPAKVHDPSGLLGGRLVPEFSLTLDSGEEFSLLGQRGRRVVLYFSAEWSQACTKLEPEIEQLARSVEASGGRFIRLEVWNLKPRKPGFGSSASGNQLAPLFNLDRMGVPCVIVIEPDGTSHDLFVGYVPGLTEAALRDVGQVTGDK